MQQNVGKTDKTVRIIAGLVIIVAGLAFQSWWAVIGLIPIATAFMGWCPAYVPLGISTCPATEARQAEKQEEKQEEPGE